MITRQQIDELSRFRNGEYLVTSCYLALDRAKMPAQMLKIRTKDLLQAAHQELSHKAGQHSQRESLRADFKRIEEYLMDEIACNRHRAVAIFACSGHKFWQAHGLPRVPRNLLIADFDPYVRPLTAILAEHHRYCTALVDRVHGEIYEVYLGQINRHEAFSDEVPRRVREGGLGGRDERQMERHHDHAVQQHYQHLAQRLFECFKSEQFERLVLGGHREVLRAFKHHLHPYLRERWVGDFHAEPSKITPPEVLARTIEIEQAYESKREQELADELVRKAEAGELAVQGLSETVAALARGEAQTVLVDQAFEQPGYACFRCHYPMLEPGACPHCQQPAEPCADIVDEVIELAMHRNCGIEHLHVATPLRDNGRIGALLRYRASVA